MTKIFTLVNFMYEKHNDEGTLYNDIMTLEEFTQFLAKIPVECEICSLKIVSVYTKEFNDEDTTELKEENEELKEKLDEISSKVDDLLSSVEDVRYYAEEIEDETRY